MGELPYTNNDAVKEPQEWLTPQIVSQMAGEGWTAALVRERIHKGEIRAARRTSKSGKHLGWLVHRSEAERFVARVQGRTSGPRRHRDPERVGEVKGRVRNSCGWGRTLSSGMTPDTVSGGFNGRESRKGASMGDRQQ